MSEAKFYAVFFDVEKPQTRTNALVLKVDKNKFANLLDEIIPDKSVELKFKDGLEQQYFIVDKKTFWTNEFEITGGQEQRCYIICTVKKEK